MLVDTSVWIDWLRDRDTPATRIPDALLDDGEAALAPVILQELLQGARDEAALRLLREQFEPLPMLMLTLATYAEAAALYARCRWQGITPRSPHDCLIARLALEHQLPLLHDDRDFRALARVAPELKLVPD